MRSGEDHHLGFDIDGNPRHTRLNVYPAMYAQICMSYQVLPDPRSLSLDEIEFYYDNIRAQLKIDTKPRR